MDAKQLTMTIDGVRNCSLRAEAFLLRQALMNLLQNAIEFSPRDEIVQVNVSVDAVATHFEIRDAGPGIPKYALDRIFERFYSLKRPDTGRKSSGLGLSLVKEIVSLHGGSVSISNRDGGGTTVRLNFPLNG